MSAETQMWVDAVERVFDVKIEFVNEPDEALIEGQLRYLRARLAERFAEMARDVVNKATSGRPNPAEFLRIPESYL
jgi:hypothetical protein